MRLKSEIWVKAYVRRCFGEGAPALIVRRGNSDAGAIFIKVNLLNGKALVFGPAPSGFMADDSERLWVWALGGDAVEEQEADSYLHRQAEFDPDFWVIEVEDRDGRHFLGNSLVTV